jgi:hypothetical protein
VVSHGAASQASSRLNAVRDTHSSEHQKALLANTLTAVKTLTEHQNATPHTRGGSSLTIRREVSRVRLAVVM